MKEWLTRTGVALDSCQSHIDESGAEGSDIEYYLAQHILVIMYAELEDKVVEIARRRMKPSSDDGMRKFIGHATSCLLKRLERKELTKFVGFFGDDSREFFKGCLTVAEVEVYNNAIKSRHKVAHSSDSSISFGELPFIVESANKLLDALDQSIKPYKLIRDEVPLCPCLSCCNGSCKS